MIPQIKIEEYDYLLTDEKIAKYPLERRDSSKLLVYRDKTPSEMKFRQIPDILPKESMIVFNDTKVVPARLYFQRDTGAHIEVFCLEPVQPGEYVSMFASVGKCRWKCIVGNAKRWKNDVIRLFNPDNDSMISRMNLRAGLVSRTGETAIVDFSWDGDYPFSHVLEICGNVPIPPYLNRSTEEIDLERYQTLYAKYRGSVAAPTAGLHFTEEVIDAIKDRNIEIETVCLHVGAGTFLPVKSSLVSEHTMHREPFVVTLDFLEKLVARKGRVVAVGTTSVRTLESLYYAGVNCMETGCPDDVGQWDPYTREYEYPTDTALTALINFMKKEGKTQLQIGTRIIIVPGFKFRVVDVLVTNFHQPQSTLLLLISAFVGGDWRTIYDFALKNDFRFLSYGDSSILFRS